MVLLFPLCNVQVTLSFDIFEAGCLAGSYQYRKFGSHKSFYRYSECSYVGGLTLPMASYTGTAMDNSLTPSAALPPYR